MLEPVSQHPEPPPACLHGKFPQALTPESLPDKTLSHLQHASPGDLVGPDGLEQAGEAGRAGLQSAHPHARSLPEQHARHILWRPRPVHMVQGSSSVSIFVCAGVEWQVLGENCNCATACGSQDPWRRVECSGFRADEVRFRDNDHARHILRQPKPAVKVHAWLEMQRSRRDLQKSAEGLVCQQLRCTRLDEQSAKHARESVK